MYPSLPDPSLLLRILLYLRFDLDQKFLRVNTVLGWLVRVMVRGADIRQDMMIVSSLVTPDSSSGRTSGPLLCTNIPVSVAGFVGPGLVEFVGVFMCQQYSYVIRLSCR